MQNSKSQSLLLVLVLCTAPAFSQATDSGDASSQESMQNQTTPPINVPPGWVMIRETAWNSLMKEWEALEAELPEHRQQATILRSLASNSGRVSDRSNESVKTLRMDLKEAWNAHEESERSLTQERLSRAVEKAELEAQIQTARNQRDQEAERANQLQKANRRNRLTWQIGIPLSAVLALLGGLLL